MKIAISGKGGVGKTLLAALLARSFAGDGYKVIAIDADPDANLPAALGFPHPYDITPIAEMKDLIEERTGARPGTIGGFFKLNPTVEDIPDRYCLEHNGIKLVVMGMPRPGGSGCFCPENALLKSLMRHLLFKRDEVVIMDMEAGIEHLGRGTAEGVDALIIVVEPGARSIETARRIKPMAEDLKIKRIFAVGNKIRSEEDKKFLSEIMGQFKFLGFIPFDERVIKAEMEGKPAFESSPDLLKAVEEIKANLMREVS
ncbi:TPA: carbon monoxide dehydrogenase [Candidatus Poribacteria bacterium]|nr:carbon monoxide dehydrogenase [Candidatus Poribacteria bacterium]